jgi:hypothetical protein
MSKTEATATASLAIKIDTSAIEAATQDCERLREAAERAQAAIDSLQNRSHGGISIHMIGEAVTIEIMPPAPVLDGGNDLKVTITK